MNEITDIGPKLVGRRVQNAARIDWGTGEVLAVTTDAVNGQAVHRVSVQFAVGHKMLMVPPARLIEPLPDEPRKPAGWIESLSATTPEDTLRALPESVTHMLGTFEQRIAVLAELYDIDDGDAGLLNWARRQSQIADPLSRWSRDELHQAFGAFCRNRDLHLRKLIGDARRQRGPSVVQDALFAVPLRLRDRVRAALA